MTQTVRLALTVTFHAIGPGGPDMPDEPRQDMLKQTLSCPVDSSRGGVV